ncbi:MAG TPA: 2-oxoacid:acceptor oxidoreductase subunit alpha [Anaerolineales bacterium]|nr:2-oxoacid:acceptor oxidoreductase subunit alpha [Anaerolineales bacterium]
MTTAQPIIEIEPSTRLGSIVNDFSITVGTPNGSGSQTSNLTILRALFKMGVPVSGKNLFPSNIQGLPTWYTIRVNRDGFLARRDEHEIVVAMNPDSFTQDLSKVQPGGAFFYSDDIRLPITRDDVVLYPMPVKQLVKETDVSPNLKNYIANMVYVGVVAEMLGIDLDKIYQALEFHFKGKQKPIEMNFNLVQKAANWAADHLEKRDPYRIEAMDATRGYIMADGNTAAALGAIYGGVQFAAWYPITPATSLAEALTEYLPTLRKEPETGKNTYAVVQAEDELAAIGMAVGAGWAGLRAMTSTSGPGLSLMVEYVGLAYYAEVPVVIWDVQRVGPSTGLPTRTSQADLTMVYFMGHGDTENVILLPGSAKECFEFGWRAFDLAERLQMPILVLSDLDIGMNQWMTQPFEYPAEPMDRGKVLWEKDLEQLDGKWARYKDVDGDGITYRTIPGNRYPSSAWFARGTGHDEFARYSEGAAEYERNMLRLRKKFETAREYVPKPVIETVEAADIGVVAFGSTESAVQEARYHLAQAGIKADFMRIRAIPFTQEVTDFVRDHEKVYVVEMNRDGQLHQLLSLEYSAQCVKLISLAHLDGLPLTARWIEEAIKAKEAANKPAKEVR